MSVITYGGNSLQTSQILTAEVDMADIPTKDAKLYALAHANASTIPFVSYPSRTVRISGKLISTSISGLDSLIDTFKSYFVAQDQNLDFDYAGSTRRFIATVNSTSISRPGGLAWANFSVEFICTNPFGQNTTQTTALNASGRTLASYTDNHTFLGTAPYQLPIATITLASFASTATNLCTNPGFETDTSGWLTAGYGGTFSRVTTQQHSGAAAMQIVNAATVTVGGYGGVDYQLTGATVGQSYIVSFWLKGSTAGQQVQCVASTNITTTATLTTGWVQYALQFTAANASVDFYVKGLTASTTWFLDDVSITTNASATVSWGNAGTGQQVSITRTWNLGDTIVIDGVKKTVTVNAQPANFTGAFAEFPPGGQSMQYNDSFLARSMSELVVYTPGWL